MRIELGITQKIAGKAIGYSCSQLANFELGLKEPSVCTLMDYEKYLTDCIDGKIQYKKSSRVAANYNRINRKQNLATKQQVLQERKIRESLDLGQQDVSTTCLKKSIAFLSELETGKKRMTQEEYATLMAYYKKVKLERIFGGGNEQ